MRSAMRTIMLGIAVLSASGSGQAATFEGPKKTPMVPVRIVCQPRSRIRLDTFAALRTPIGSSLAVLVKYHGLRLDWRAVPPLRRRYAFYGVMPEDKAKEAMAEAWPGIAKISVISAKAGRKIGGILAAAGNFDGKAASQTGELNSDSFAAFQPVHVTRLRGFGPLPTLVGHRDGATSTAVAYDSRKNSLTRGSFIFKDFSPGGFDFPGGSAESRVQALGRRQLAELRAAVSRFLETTSSSKAVRAIRRFLKKIDSKESGSTADGEMDEKLRSFVKDEIDQGELDNDFARVKPSELKTGARSAYEEFKARYGEPDVYKIESPSPAYLLTAMQDDVMLADLVSLNGYRIAAGLRMPGDGFSWGRFDEPAKAAD